MRWSCSLAALSHPRQLMSSLRSHQTQPDSRSLPSLSLSLHSLSRAVHTAFRQLSLPLTLRVPLLTVVLVALAVRVCTLSGPSEVNSEELLWDIWLSFAFEAGGDLVADSVTFSFIFRSGRIGMWKWRISASICRLSLSASSLLPLWGTLSLSLSTLLLALTRSSNCRSSFWAEQSLLSSVSRLRVRGFSQWTLWFFASCLWP